MHFKMRVTCFVFVIFKSVFSMRGMSVNSYVLNGTSGYIKSQNYPSHYPPSHVTKWQIYVPAEYRIVLRFVYFDIEDSRTCNYDFLTVYDASDVDNERIRGTFCGTNTPSSITSISNSLTLYFKTDRTKQRPGFRLYYARIPADCSFNFNDEEGRIESPSFYGEYANDLRCKYTISFPKNKILSLEFIEFSLQVRNSFELCQDYIQIGSPYNGSREREKHCGTELPRSYTFYSGKAVLFFITDSDKTAAGFRANYTVIDIEDCLNMTQGLEYRGFTNVSSEGHNCLFWDSPLLSDHVNGSLIDEKNYCRNPNGLEKPWCYVITNITEITVEYCDIPSCESSFTSESTTINQENNIVTTGQVPMETTYSQNAGTTDQTYINIQGNVLGGRGLGDEITIPVVTLSCILILVLATAGVFVCHKIYRKKILTKPDVRIRSVINPQYIASKDISNGYIVSYENTEIGNQINIDIRASLRRSQRKRRIQNGTIGKDAPGNTTNNNFSEIILRDTNGRGDRSNSVNSNDSDGEARYSTVLDLDILPEVENPYAEKDELYDVLRRQRTRRKKPEDENNYGSIIVFDDDDLYSHTASFGRISTLVPKDIDSELKTIDDSVIYENGPSAGSSCTDIDIYSNDRARLV